MQSSVPTIGDTVLGGKYRLEDLIGSGGMGQVFKATHIENGGKIAVKFLRDKHADNPQFIKRFQQEARLAASIGHDNICEVTDLGTDEAGFHYLVMPFLHGESMDKFINNDDGLPLALVLDWMCQTLSALDAAHNAHIIHRDLKPNNIFITRVGDREDFIKLLDFGISKVLGNETSADITESGIALGTPHYMAPEIAQGARDIDYRVDIYSAGVILYKALTGRKPFEGNSYNEVMFNIVSAQFPMPRSVNPLIPPEVEAVITKAMARNRDARYSTADEMHRALESCPKELLEAAVSDETFDSTLVAETLPPFSSLSDTSDSSKIHMGLKSIGIGLSSIIFIIVAVLLWPKEKEISTEEQNGIQTPHKIPETEPKLEPPSTEQAPIDEEKEDRVVKKTKKKKRRKNKPPKESEEEKRDPTTVDGRMDTVIFTEF